LKTIKTPDNQPKHPAYAGFLGKPQQRKR